MRITIGLLFVSLLFSSNTFAQSRPGYFYYTKDGVKTEGLLKLTLNDDKSTGAWALSYRQTKKGEKTTYTTRDICCFVIKGDSFAIIKNIKPNRGPILKSKPYAMDFAEVVETGRINLYKYLTWVNDPRGSYTIADWVIEKDGELETLSQLHFDVQMAKYIADYPALLYRLQSNQLEYTNAKDDTRAMIKYYNEYARINLK